MSDIYEYRFKQEVSIPRVEETLLLAVLASEALHGRAQVQLEAEFSLNLDNSTCSVDVSTSVGRCIARIFTGFLTYEFGEAAFEVQRGPVAKTAHAETPARLAEVGR